ncbi:zinc metalloprotease HtpX [Campylobacter hominis]|uniref:Protease HtpX homolog n=1 Tax=Campylobacter hominis (strain ATCC BAA-381 / DSM 21671 / CCUG 45161 / LMG 19568 / NCTC 13146 / CH001A) TaxID=360107 RepID=HTPX_CAMHC|nr:zinc metalloprotease HtpX [Campylobacter hominis]A7I0F9.1 RecName: Full=Protease HtpX homolog [Campylobacter hominis ATCC BAA-381]ABS51651.1 Zn-dependent protease with chaperone function [Campylobacter hominis ATCC BAA-381]UAK85164.1 zinc metalloprotease HtpX [Campylobacter hominis]SUW84549.1 M48 family peptidase [Campylobacter hominis]
MEQIKTFILMTFLALIFMFFGGLIGGEQGVIIAFVVALGMNFFSYFFSDKLVLKHYHAVKVDENSAGGLYAIVRRLANAANVPMPSVYIIPEQIPNAFATGRNPNNAAVAVTEGLLNLLSENEIEGVLAHEMSHVRHYDILIGSVAAVFAGAIAILANFAKFGAVFGGNENNRQNGILMIVAAIIMPIAAAIIQMAISRSREYKADAGAANLTKHPEWLISALSKLENYAQNRTMQNATPQSAHMFIINPFSGVKSSFSQLFRTHPSTKDRIARLNEIKQSM